MISKDTLDKFFADLQKDINARDKQSKERAEASLIAAFEGYNRRVAERIVQQRHLLAECQRTGDDFGVRQHETLIEIYKSLFQIDNNQQVSE
ncbi:MAG TPA: hypothetical protein VGQ13_01575 [Nitrososphaera sp.]|nr:hypothetical protein [Nitrososphaera sp.]